MMYAISGSTGVVPFGVSDLSGRNGRFAKAPGEHQGPLQALRLGHLCFRSGEVSQGASPKLD